MKRYSYFTDVTDINGGSWLFPYAIAFGQDTFNQSPRHNSSIDWKELENQFSDLSSANKVFQHLTESHYVNKPSNDGLLNWNPQLSANLPLEAYTRAHFVTHLNQEEPHEHPDIEPMFTPAHMKELNQIDIQYGAGGISDEDAHERIMQVEGHAKNGIVVPDAAWTHLVMNHGLPIDMLPREGHTHTAEDHSAILADSDKALQHLAVHHGRNIPKNIDSGIILDLSLRHQNTLHNPHFLHDKHHTIASYMQWKPHHHEAGDPLMVPGYDGNLSIPGKEQVDTYGFPAMR